jgi:DNA polymerase-2
MHEHTGWLLDLYAALAGGISLWLLADDSRARLQLHMAFPITFYAAGDFSTLRRAWRFLQGRDVTLARTRRRDLFTGERDLLAVTVPGPARIAGVFRELSAQFPGLDYYDADIPISLRFTARTGVHLLGRCRVREQGGQVSEIKALDSPWEIDPPPLPLRILCLSPDVDPAHRTPRRLQVRHDRAAYELALEPRRALLTGLRALLGRYDPDLILTDYGDTWLFPQLQIWCRESGLPLNPNRDPQREVLTRKADSYFAYGQVIHRGAQAHLFGRWHIDRRNAMLFSEYALQGVLEQTRVTGIGVQEMARKSPGAGITAMQMLTALRTGVLVPVVKQQAEGRKSLAELIRADKGGLVYQPIIGLHRDVAEIDFASMYPSIMVRHNISPETTGQADAPPGLVPQTLRPLLEKRLKLKELLRELDPRDCRVKPLKARAAALKWLLVVCFGYLGYKNARFGKIESHEAVTAISRELMLQAKEVAEDLGFEVLHMYVDSLFIRQEGLREARDFAPLLQAIRDQTGISIALEGVFRWVSFLPSRRDSRVPVPNRYLGVFQDGSVKYRGIEARRHDTPPWVSQTQLAVLNCLAQAGTLDQVSEFLPEAQALIAQAKRDLRNGRVPPEHLLVTQKLSRAVEAYKTPSPSARAAAQLQAAGENVAPGQFMRFVYTRDRCGVRAWDLPGELDPRLLDTQRYCTLLDRSLESVLAAFSGLRCRTFPLLDGFQKIMQAGQGQPTADTQI